MANLFDIEDLPLRRIDDSSTLKKTFPTSVDSSLSTSRPRQFDFKAKESNRLGAVSKLVLYSLETQQHLPTQYRK
jgi:hypothetical protein